MTWDIFLPQFNDDHALSPSGDEPWDDRWELWNDQAFDLAEYSETYWFYLGDPRNAWLLNELAELERLVSWSTARYFRWHVRQDKSFGRVAFTDGPRTLKEINEGPARIRAGLSNPAVTVIPDWIPSLWQPPSQHWLRQPPPPRYSNDPRPFAERLKEYREQKKEEGKLIKMNKAHRTKARIAPRPSNYRGLAEGPRKRR